MGITNSLVTKLGIAYENQRSEMLEMMHIRCDGG